MKVQFTFTPIPFEPTQQGRHLTVLSAYRVTGRYGSTRRVLGTVEHLYINHLKGAGWQATGADGHRAVHETRIQAAKALDWDGKGYPFPLAKGT